MLIYEYFFAILLTVNILLGIRTDNYETKYTHQAVETVVRGFCDAVFSRGVGRHVVGTNVVCGIGCWSFMYLFGLCVHTSV